MMGPDVMGAIRTVKAVKAVEPKLNQLKKATGGFESVFVKGLLEAMRKGVKETHFGDSTGSDTYQGMMDDALSDALARQKILGLGEMMYRPMAKQVLAAELGRAQPGAKTATAPVPNKENE